MELQFPSFPALFAFLFFVFIVLKKVQRSKAKNPAPKLPPGPWKLPLIGNVHQLIGSLPHRCLKDLAMKHGPLMHLQLGEASIVVVSSAEIAKEVMKTHDINFAHRPSILGSRILLYNATDIAFSPYGEYWRQLRKICTVELLNSKRVQSFRSIREEEVSKLIKTISAHGRSPINLSEKIFSLTYCIVSRAAFGEQCKDQDAFMAVMTDILAYLGGFSIADMYPSIKWLPLITGIKSKLEEVGREVDRVLENIVNAHKEGQKQRKTDNREAEGDLVDVLLKLQEDGELQFPVSNTTIKAVIMDIFSGGSETSSTTVEWIFTELMRNPRVMKKAQAEVRQVFDGKGNVDETGIHELKYLKCVIKETLRMHPPAALFLRECGEACKINGYDIPAKTRVMINAWAIGRDPKYWTEAERFYPERFIDSPIDYKGTNFEYVPFGGGRRVCPGIAFALPNVDLPLAQLLYHFDWKLPDGAKGEDLDMTEVFGMSVGRKQHLHLIPLPYHPSPVE